MLRVMHICIQMISQALLLNVGEENVFTVVFSRQGQSAEWSIKLLSKSCS